MEELDAEGGPPAGLMDALSPGVKSVKLILAPTTDRVSARQGTYGSSLPTRV